MLEDIELLRELNMGSMILRILLAMLMGGVIGLDREKKGRPAGFRTYMLVSLGAAITVILSQYLNLMLDTSLADAFGTVGQRTDVARLGASVISGIGFIGTGTIMVTARHEIKGLTTASCLWASACMGLAIGAGFYECFFVGFVLIALSINVLPALEHLIVSNARNMNIYAVIDSMEHLGPVISRMKADGLQLYEVELDKNEPGERKLSGTFCIRLPHRQSHADLLAKLSALDGVLAIEEV
jgi:putative Mg2+ transporter-C (MgtC) family protein